MSNAIPTYFQTEFPALKDLVRFCDVFLMPVTRPDTVSSIESMRVLSCCAMLLTSWLMVLNVDSLEANSSNLLLFCRLLAPVSRVAVLRLPHTHLLLYLVVSGHFQLINYATLVLIWCQFLIFFLTIEYEPLWQQKRGLLTVGNHEELGTTKFYCWSL